MKDGPAFLLAAVFVIASCGGADRPFSSSEWKSLMAGGKTTPALAGMARSLVNQRTLLGKSGQEVVELLGPAQPSSPSEYCWEWVLDNSTVDMTYTILEVRISASGTVTEASIMERPY